MTIDDKIIDEKDNMLLTDKQQKYQQYLLIKQVNINILQVKEILPFDQSRIIEQAKFTYFPIGKAFEKSILFYAKFYCNNCINICLHHTKVS